MHNLFVVSVFILSNHMKCPFLLVCPMYCKVIHSIKKTLFSLNCLENNKIFFNGRSIFGANETYGNRIRSSDIGGHCIIKHNYEIVDFQKFCLDDQGNVDDLVDIVAGKQHFAVLTSEYATIYAFQMSGN